MIEEGEVGGRDGEMEARLGRCFPSSFDEEFASQMIYILDNATASSLSLQEADIKIITIMKKHTNKPNYNNLDRAPA